MPHDRLQTDREADAFVRGLIRRFLIAIALGAGIVVVSTVGLVAFGRHQDSEIAGHQLSHFMVKPHATEFIDSAIGEGELGFAEITVDAHPLLQDRPLRELELPRTKRVIVISIIDRDGAQEFNPGADRVLRAGDTLLAVGNERDLLRLASEE